MSWRNLLEPKGSQMELDCQSTTAIPELSGLLPSSLPSTNGAVSNTKTLPSTNGVALPSLGELTLNPQTRTIPALGGPGEAFVCFYCHGTQ